MGPGAFWLMIICVSGMWAVVAIVSKVVDGVVKMKQARLDLEKEYLTEMMSEIEEIKTRLNYLRQGEPASPNR